MFKFRYNIDTKYLNAQGQPKCKRNIKQLSKNHPSKARMLSFDGKSSPIKFSDIVADKGITTGVT